jgi:Flp pilus assembly protein TadB
MGLEATTLAYISAGATAVGTGVGIYKQRKAYKQQRKASRAQEKIQQIKMNRERRKQAAEAIRLRAVQTANAQQAGILDSSGLEGARGGLTSTVASNLGYLNTLNAYNTTISGARGQAAKYTSQANTASAVGEIGQRGLSLWGDSLITE